MIAHRLGRQTMSGYTDTEKYPPPGHNSHEQTKSVLWGYFVQGGFYPTANRRILCVLSNGGYNVIYRVLYKDCSVCSFLAFAVVLAFFYLVRCCCALCLVAVCLLIMIMSIKTSQVSEIIQKQKTKSGMENEQPLWCTKTHVRNFSGKKCILREYFIREDVDQHQIGIDEFLGGYPGKMIGTA